MLNDLYRVKDGRTGRASSWDVSGRNADAWLLEPGEARVLADIKGPAVITHIWMTQSRHYRECLLRITWDNARHPSVVVPLGDFFCLGHGIVNSFQSLLFSGSTQHNNRFNAGCALNCYVPMPFRERAVVELVNESKEPHGQYFYIDYEAMQEIPADAGYFHAEFHRENPFRGWGPSVRGNPVNKGRAAWENNYVILETKGRGHYVGCNYSITNFCGGWWGEGDDMIWVDGYKWPPDLHGTGSEDYLNQAWGMQDNAFLRNGSSIFENNTNGYQSSYVFHIENPVRFKKDLKVTIEHGHANNLANEVSSVAYWYAEKPTRIRNVPPVAKRMPVARDTSGRWIHDLRSQCPGKAVGPTAEMKKLKAKAEKKRR